MALKKQYRFEFGGIEIVSTVSLADAKKRCMAEVEAAVTGEYEPVLLTYRGNMALITRSAIYSRWESRMIWKEDSPVNGVLTRPYSASWGKGDKAGTIADCKMHLAQAGWEPTDDDSVMPSILDVEQYSEFKSWAKFQRDMYRYKEMGFNHNDAHNLTGHFATPALSVEGQALLEKLGGFKAIA